jgi:uncharacterized membrane protein YphA (DoxX/SURF4 family)
MSLRHVPKPRHAPVGAPLPDWRRVPVATAPSETATVQGMGRVPSLAVIGVIGGAALIIGPRLPLLNAVVVALVLGAVLANVAGRLGTLNEAVSRFMLKDALKFAVVLLGLASTCRSSARSASQHSPRRVSA